MKDASYEQLAREIAPLLPGAWSVVPDDDNYYGTHIQSGSDMLYVSGSRQRGQVHISGSMPESTLRTARHGINVSAERGPAVMAREITRRLLPAYRADLQRVAEYEEAKSAGNAACIRLLARIAAMFPGSHVREHSRHGYTDTDAVVTGRAGGSGTVSASGDASTVRIDLHGVPAETAVRMLAVFAESGKTLAVAS